MGCLIKITSIREATDREPNFATTEVSEIKSGLEKRCPTLGRHRERLFHSIEGKIVIKL